MNKLNNYLYYKDSLTRLFFGDSKDILQNIPDNYVDALICDPPYGIFFMQKEWDKALPPIEIWKECLRVLKPGAFAFIMSIPRMDCQSRLAIMLEDAGFNISFTPMYHCFASGFPKSQNISKAVDRKLGTYKEGEILPSSRVVVGENNFTTFAKKTAANPQSEKAKELNGSYAGFQPKPAVEIIIVAMKPIDKKTYVAQALDNNHGITWLDNCRIPYISEDDMIPQLAQDKRVVNSREMYGGNSYYNSSTKAIIGGSKDGRFPANLLVSDNILDTGEITNTRPHGGNGRKLDTQNQGWGFKRLSYYGYDSGGFSRYFSLDAWWDKKIQDLPGTIQKTFPFLICPKAAKSEKNKGCEDLPKQKVATMEMRKQEQLRISDNPDYDKSTVISPPEKNNVHPSVKPLKLMSYLITLGSEEGEIILDPFVGSGTTCVAAKMLKRKSIGCEINKEYCEITKKRLESV